MHECSPEHFYMGTARMKYDKDTLEEGKKRKLKMVRTAEGMKKSPDDLL